MGNETVKVQVEVVPNYEVGDLIYKVVPDEPLVDESKRPIILLDGYWVRPLDILGGVERQLDVLDVTLPFANSRRYEVMNEFEHIEWIGYDRQPHHALVDWTATEKEQRRSGRKIYRYYLHPRMRDRMQELGIYKQTLERLWRSDNDEFRNLMV